MSRLARCLAAEGYAVINCDYPSRTADIQTLATGLFDGLTPLLSAAPKVHVVTHSMGGVLLRVYLQDHALPNLGRVVMLGPPSCGSEVVDRLGALAPFGWLNGPAGGQLGTDANSVPNRLKPPDFELGVIAGDRSVNPILSMLIPGRDDGKVSVTRTQTAGMRDFIRLHVTHPFMMRNTRVICQTAHFLKTGRFQKSTE
jgi:alpha-beta hydrolase superfamily lysophospholipase